MEPTRLQLEILVLCAQGLTRHEIAAQLDYSPWTIKRRLDDLRETLHARNTLQATAICIARGYICVDGRRERTYIPEPLEAAA